MAKGFYADVSEAGKTGPVVRFTVNLARDGEDENIRVLVAPASEFRPNTSVLLSSELTATVEGLPAGLVARVRWSNG